MLGDFLCLQEVNSGGKGGDERHERVAPAEEGFWMKKGNITDGEVKDSTQSIAVISLTSQKRDLYLLTRMYLQVTVLPRKKSMRLTESNMAAKCQRCVHYVHLFMLHLM